MPDKKAWIDVHIQYIHEGMLRIEADMKKKHDETKLLIKEWLRKKSEKWVQHAMVTFISLICIAVIWAVVSQVVVAFKI